MSDVDATLQVIASRACSCERDATPATPCAACLATERLRALEDEELDRRLRQVGLSLIPEWPGDSTVIGRDRLRELPMSMTETADSYEAAEAKQAEVFQGLDYCDEANRDIAKALASLEIQMQAALRPPPAIHGDVDPTDPEAAPRWSPLRERLSNLNAEQHAILRHIQELSERVAV